MSYLLLLFACLGINFCFAASSSSIKMPAQDLAFREFAKEKLLSAVDVWGPDSHMRTTVVKDADVFLDRQALELTVALVTHPDPTVAEIFAEEALAAEYFADSVWYTKAIGTCARESVSEKHKEKALELPEMIALIKIVRDNCDRWPEYYLQVARVNQATTLNYSYNNVPLFPPNLELLNIGSQGIEQFSRSPEIEACLAQGLHDQVQTWWGNCLSERGEIGIQIYYKQIQTIWNELFDPASMDRSKRRASF